MPRKKKAPWENDPAYLYEEIGIDTPHDRAMSDSETKANWPEGWWAVSDFNDGYIAYFANEPDACAFKLLLTMSIMNGVEIGNWYRDKIK